MGKNMTLMEKISFNFRKYFVNKSWRTNKNVRLMMVLMSFIIISLIIVTKLDRAVYRKNEINFDNFYQVSEVKKVQKEDLTGSEETTINLKAMFIGVIVLVCYFGLKKGAFGVTLGTFLGAILGVWLALLFPSFFYFFELLCRWMLRF
ncbi:hypothetical protein [Italian clover phyllody phytoplasma]|uniref:hypothetical protein n=1 Tax=Italian clover phyllody phytoplasma TaxID=1196420 RepID=UPI0002D9BF20|nr:hypothetical protein [Italian clover phyllody phytoplasma]